MEKIDIRPSCITCGKPWMPPEGVNALRVACNGCAEPLNYDEITPGVRKLVRLLRDAGFKTIDSGDGVTNVEAGMEGALEIPHVHIMTTRDTMIDEAYRLQRVIGDALPLGHGIGQVQAMFDPGDGIATLSLFGITDDMLRSAA